MEKNQKPVTIDEYITMFPLEVQVILEKLRRIVHEVVPDVKEGISYSMPTFKLKGNLVHFAG